MSSIGREDRARDAGSQQGPFGNSISRRRRWGGLLLASVILGLGAWLVAGSLAASYLCRIYPSAVPTLDRLGEYAVEDVRFEAPDGVELAAWWVAADPKRAVILLHGISGNRASSVRRAELYLDRGWSVLMPDLRGHGRSGGDRVSFGWRESEDLAAARGFVRGQGVEWVAAHGVSMGAATIAYDLRRDPDYRFVVLESCYDDIENAFGHRIERYPLPGLAFWPIELFTIRRIGAAADDLVPAKYVARCRAPTLFLAGDAEELLPVHETERLFAACGSSAKTVNFFGGAGHVDFERFDPERYREILSAFLDSLPG